MAFMEGKLQPIDLLAALQARRGLQDDLESRRQRELQNKLLQQQLEANKWNLQKEKDLASATTVPDKTANMLTGQYANFLNLRQPLREMPGYVEGTSPAQYEAEQMAIRQALASGGGVRGGGGPSDAETNLMNQQANLAEEQARQAQYKRQGYGSAIKDKLAEQAIATKLGVANNKQYDQMIGDLRDQSKQRWSDINAVDKMISNTKSIGNEMRGEIAATQNKENAAQQAKQQEQMSENILSDKLTKNRTYIVKSKNFGKDWSDKAKTEFANYYQTFQSLMKREPTDAEVSKFLADNIK